MDKPRPVATRAVGRTYIKHEVAGRLRRLGLTKGWSSCSEGGHAYVPSVGAAMVVEGFPQLAWWMTATTSIIKG